jgi:hypothetical protein
MPQLRNDLEVRFNSAPEPGRKGFFSEFQQSDLVRFIAQGGEQTDIQFVGVRNQDYVMGGYQLQLSYRVTTPECVLDLIVPVHGTRSPTKEFQGRQWQVLWREIGLRQLTPTAEGKAMLELQAQAQGFLENWLKELRAGQVDQAYLSTRDSARRKDLWQDYQARSRTLPAAAAGSLAAGGWAGLAGPLAGFLGARELCLPGYQEFLKGGMVRADAEKFWPANRRDEVVEQVRKLFERPDPGLGIAIHRDRVRLLPWTREGDQLRLWQDVVVRVGKYQVDGFLIVECNATALESAAPPAWRVAGLELIRAREPTAAPPRDGPPPGP